MIATSTAETMREADPYLAAFDRFEETEAGGRASWIYPIRKSGISRFAELGFPTLRDEDWRFTNVAPIAQMPFRPVAGSQDHGLKPSDIARFNFMAIPSNRLVFVDGHFAEDLSSLQPHKKGIHVGSLAEALVSGHPVLQKYLAQYADVEKNAFTALNTAFFADGAFIYLPEGSALDQPVHLLFISTGRETDSASFPRNLIVADKGSRLTLLENHVSTGSNCCFSNGVTEFVGGENSVVEHCKLQDENLASFHVAGLYTSLARAANYIFHSIATGANLSRNNIHTALNGEGVECILNGLYLTKDQQLADHWMFVEHARPHCNSHEYFNGILDDKSKGVFHGRIYVEQEAQKTDAKQTNKNLLLSDEATVNTKPQLEIYADDVKCTHGATVGQLNDDAIFYLRARGIGLETARRMLIHSFAGEIIERVRFQPAREELDQVIWDRLELHHRVSVAKKA